jgi:outer membrane scaffolding protein for murein synthesis (MipA/OmpV family)
MDGTNNRCLQVQPLLNTFLDNVHMQFITDNEALLAALCNEEGEAVSALVAMLPWEDSAHGFKPMDRITLQECYHRAITAAGQQYDVDEYTMYCELLADSGAIIFAPHKAVAAVFPAKLQTLVEYRKSVTAFRLS